jgi:hypothetical protein
MKKLGYSIDQSSKLIIIAVNGQKARALGEIHDFPLKVKNAIFKHDLQVIDSSDEVLILGNDWLKKAKTTLDWNKQILILWKGSKQLILPVRLTKSHITKTEEIDEEEEYEEDWDEEYEEEELDESTIYFSDFSDEFIMDDLEFNS